jgi:Tfp pilus assembly protein PilO
MKKKYAPHRAGQPRTWLITALLAAGAIAYVVFVFLPAQRSIQELRSNVQERHQQILQAQTQVRTVALAQQRLAETREVGQQWRADAPQQSELITHFASLSKQAEAAGVTIERTDPSPAVEMHLLAQQNVVVQFQATFAAAFEFVRRIEAMPGTIWIRNLRLEAASETSNIVRGELTLTIFVDRADYSD